MGWYKMFIQLLLETVEIKNQKYINWYIALCNKAIVRQGGYYTKNKKDALKSLYGYVEVHHILPRSLCQNKEYISDKTNKIILTAKEHFIAHALLAYATRNHKMILAIKMMSNKTKNDRYFGSNTYRSLREAIAKVASVQTKNNIEKNGHPLLGVPVSEETKKKISKSLTGKVQSVETINKRANSIKEKFSNPENIHGNTGREYDDKYRENMSNICKKIKKNDDWNNKNAVANTGRVHIANKVTKERKRPKRDVAEQMIKESNGEWIYCHCTAKISD